MKKQSITIADGVYTPSVNSISGTDSSAVKIMREYLVEEGRSSFINAVSLNVNDLLKYLQVEKLEHNNC